MSLNTYIVKMIPNGAFAVFNTKTGLIQSSWGARLEALMVMQDLNEMIVEQAKKAKTLAWAATLSKKKAA